MDLAYTPTFFFYIVKQTNSIMLINLTYCSTLNGSKIQYHPLYTGKNFVYATLIKSRGSGVHINFISYFNVIYTVQTVDRRNNILYQYIALRIIFLKDIGQLQQLKRTCLYHWIENNLVAKDTYDYMNFIIKNNNICRQMIRITL